MQPDYNPHEARPAGRVAGSDAVVMTHRPQKPNADPAPDCAVCADTAMVMKEAQSSQLGLS